MAFRQDFSDLPQALFRFAIDQFVWQGILDFNSSTNTIAEAPNANKLRTDSLAHDRYAYWAWWLRFGAGFENLVKAVFLRHQVSLFTKRNLVNKAPGGSDALTTPAAAHVYKCVAGVELEASTNPWLASQFQQLGINHPWEINSGTLGKYRSNLHKLTACLAITPAEETQLSDALTVLADIRRNVDVHIFLKSQTAGSVNDDLIAVYLPACNILLRAFQ